MTLLSMCSCSSVDRAPACVQEVMGLIPVKDSDFFFVPCPCHVDQFTFQYLYGTGGQKDLEDMYIAIHYVKVLSATQQQ